LFIRQHPILRYTRIETPQTILLVKKETARDVTRFLKLLDSEKEIRDEVRYFRSEIVGLATRYIDNVTKVADKLAYRYRDIIHTPLDHIQLAMFLSVSFPALMITTLTTSIIYETQHIVRALNKQLVKDVILSTLDDITSRYMLFLVNEETNMAVTIADTIDPSIFEEEVKQKKSIVPIIASDVGLIITPKITFTISEDAAESSLTVIGNIMQRFTEKEIEEKIREGEKLAEKYKNRHYLTKIPLAVLTLENVARDIALEVCKQHRGEKLRKCIDDIISYVLATTVASIDIHREELVSKIARRIEKYITTM